MLILDYVACYKNDANGIEWKLWMIWFLIDSLTCKTFWIGSVTLDANNLKDLCSIIAL